jgi:methylated-DNA-[protein]-cysteine S-methyltransferase
VWSALRQIPVGRTLAYGALAAQVDAPKAFRAVGLANGANPVAIIVPCHRVIGADGSLTGFGGGLPRKQWLLQHEGVRLRAPTPPSPMSGMADEVVRAKTPMSPLPTDDFGGAFDG